MASSAVLSFSAMIFKQLCLSRFRDFPFTARSYSIKTLGEVPVMFTDFTDSSFLARKGCGPFCVQNPKPAGLVI